MTGSQNFAVANFHRSAAAGIANAEAARSALQVLGGDCPPRWRQVAEARIAAPTAPWADIADSLGMTKHEAASVFRRLVNRARELA